MAKDMSSRQLKGKQKGAILMVTLGNEVAAKTYKNLDETSIEVLTLEIANLRKISSEQRLAVLKDAQEIILAREYMSQGGVDYAREVLEKALGPERAQSLLTRITASLQVRPFDFMRHSDPQQLISFIQGEHPQTIALILSYLTPEQSAAVIGRLSASMQAEVTKRVAKMDRITPEVLREVERVLERKFSTIIGQDFTMAGGIDSVVEIINRVDRGTERNIMENLEENDPELAEEIKRRLFVFEDISGLDDRSIQRVLREVEMKDLGLALKGATEDLKTKFTKNMSQRAADMLTEDMQYMGPVRVRDVEEAQQKIVNVVRALEDAGEIVIARGGEEELIV
ncbi:MULTISPECIES: flagellar motor switch protein FliG [Dethiosulfovibrio]|jgi:flagellar motor switch protein FliG|uniref:Flagellar motor switch protein FliG n=2 Tax=Dethiosulfovibrio TaxID=47054 RepID=A0ABS9EK55_9BACT|nr:MULTISPECIES: flagellar motor switch protein FliG [Dethiosulfovibrio]MCF4113996.1 flagellar motor switch protein FliG [Dethiosulfovibrio russensis]MCF4141591.1 flagellar motor switch protein FliG [Dethiosulfovibrio marinus]MCF4143992.1 flagellar motor switch protein FliG [Dethiosulfovibrio acidaminovorans]MEA3284702.1 flagellar motor switch protein FliG [Synergistota bacterium]